MRDEVFVSGSFAERNRFVDDNMALGVVTAGCVDHGAVWRVFATHE